MATLPAGTDFGRDRDPAGWIEKHTSVTEDEHGHLTAYSSDVPQQMHAGSIPP